MLYFRQSIFLMFLTESNRRPLQNRAKIGERGEKESPKSMKESREK